MSASLILKVMKATQNLKVRCDMTKEEFIKYHKDFCEKAHEISKKKNRDYTGDCDDPFANFRKAEQLGFCSVEAGIASRLSDKFCRIGTYLNRGKFEVETEALEETVLDAVNYLIFLAAHIKSKKEEK